MSTPKEEVKISRENIPKQHEAQQATSTEKRLESAVSLSSPQIINIPSTQQVQLSTIQPITIKIESETDWPVVLSTIFVGIGSILITLVIGWLASATQKSQIRSSTANFRHEWQKELRTKISDFIGKIALLHSAQLADKDHLNKPLSDNDYSELIKSQVVLELMLDNRKKSTKEFISLMEENISYLKNGDTSKLTTATNALIEKGNYILEQAWQDIRSDVGVGS